MTNKTTPAAPSDERAENSRDWGQTLFLPVTDFSMRAGLPELEPRLLKRWADMGLYKRLREAGKGRAKFLLHDGPPYANGNIHIGHALNKILKDLVTRSQQMLGYDSNYVPGWDCHGLPIEWKIEEEYIAKGKPKPNMSDPAAMTAFRQECRAFAEHWLNVQREEFKRLGVEGDWAHPYSTMTFPAEAQIARELMKFAETEQLYRGSKPVMWSVVEKTALAEAEVEYHDYQSDMVWVKFPVDNWFVALGPERSEYRELLWGASIAIWTTTPWTIPGNRAISFNPKIKYCLYEVTKAPVGNLAAIGDKLVIAEKLAEPVMKAARVDAYENKCELPSMIFHDLYCEHPLRKSSPIEGGYAFKVPMLNGDHVTDEDGTGFVHTAPGHGRDDFDIWMAKAAWLRECGVSTEIPYTVDENGALTKDAPGFEGKRVITDKGEKGDANRAVADALRTAGMLLTGMRTLKHQYPHSWRSKKPVIFRNTPQWFIHMDKAVLPLSPSLRGEGRGEGQPHGKTPSQ